MLSLRTRPKSTEFGERSSRRRRRNTRRRRRNRNSGDALLVNPKKQITGGMVAKKST
jgi:hypothetical protein